jgi:hypothetical protein
LNEGFFGFDVLDFDFGCEKFPRARLTPDTVKVVPLTAVTFPDVIAKLASCERNLEAAPEPPGNDGRVPPDPERVKPPPPLRGNPPPENAPRPVVVPEPTRVQDPDELGAFTVMLRAATVVLDFFDAVPVIVTQSPVVIDCTVSVEVLENVVLGVQLTVVCPVLVFCTSMLELLRAATLPEAPVGALLGVAAPALAATAVAATSAAAPVPSLRAQCRRVELRPVGVCIAVCPSFL